jgi:hypothetical protein
MCVNAFWKPCWLVHRAGGPRSALENGSHGSKECCVGSRMALHNQAQSQPLDESGKWAGRSRVRNYWRIVVKGAGVGAKTLGCLQQLAVAYSALQASLVDSDHVISTMTAFLLNRGTTLLRAVF